MRSWMFRSSVHWVVVEANAGTERHVCYGGIHIQVDDLCQRIPLQQGLIQLEWAWHVGQAMTDHDVASKVVRHLQQ